MSGEILQFLVVGGVVVVGIAAWLILIYRPRRTGEGNDATDDKQPEDRKP